MPACVTHANVVGDRSIKVPVAGNLAKVHSVSSVKDDPVASRMLSSLKASFERIEGSQEVRASMRKIIDAYRVCYGQPIMVTFSPNERLQVLVVRMHRVRSGDPCFRSKANEGLVRWCEIDEPSLVRVSMEDLAEPSDADGAVLHIPLKNFAGLPSLNDREKIAAKDPLACVYAFNVTCAIALETLFGFKTCSRCPDCDCRDRFGSSCHMEGGVFGRGDAYCASKECQKSGASCCIY